MKKNLSMTRIFGLTSPLEGYTKQKEVMRMTEANYESFFQQGDWVSGTSVWDEKFIGYVDSAPKLEGGAVLVRITQCDRKRLINTLVQTREHRLSRLTDLNPVSEEEWTSLIELALITHDKEWFDELTFRRAETARLELEPHGGQGRDSLKHPPESGWGMTPQEE
ncbi:hypothetical protein WMW72_08975 [Paenibacillus filicis]|uniref:IDEAL domain-containing protein n=1 Tax=Paenibacillus filicis TaxID=669464 RepID=A0ABU9DGN4_9BACL